MSDDPAVIVDAEARRLDRRGVDIIILSSHLQGIPSERALVAQLRRVDAGIAGGAALPTANGRFPQIAGFSMVVDPAPAAGSRVRSSTLAGGTPIVMNGAVVAGPAIDIGTTNSPPTAVTATRSPG